jgi:glycosyltransferase involved in cell wall biosynthesis
MDWSFWSFAYEQGLRPDSGGFRKLWEVAWALQTLGHTTRVFYPRLPGWVPLRDVPSVAYPVVHGAVVRPLTAHLSMALATLQAARHARPDIIYMRTHINLLPLPIARALRARLLVEVNADSLQFLEQERAPRWKRHLFEWVERINLRGAHLVVALTPGLRQMVVERYGVPAERVCVIPSGTDLDHFAPDDAGRCRRQLGLDPARPTVGFVGLFYRHQGVGTLLEALARLRRSHPDVAGLIVGDGIMRRTWEAQAERLGLDGAVRFTGQVPYARVPVYLNAMDVLAAPFTGDRGETSPFKVLDLMACARPVVASDLPSVRTLADDSGALTLVPPDDAGALAQALGDLLDRPERRAELGRRGREHVHRHHGWRGLAGALESSVRSALEVSAR